MKKERLKNFENNFTGKIGVKNSVLCILLVIAFFCGFSCKKEFNKITNPDWNPALAIPFINTIVDLNELVEEDSSIVVNDDNSIKIVYSKDSIINIRMDDVFEVPAQEEKIQKFSFGDILFPDFFVSDTLFLEGIIDYIETEARDTILKYEGRQAVFPPFSLKETFQTGFYIQSEFRELTFSEGMLLLSIENNLPVTIKHLTIQVVNKTREQIIAEFSFGDIETFATISDSIVLAGMTLENSFGFNVLELSSTGSYPDSVLISLSDGVGVKLHAYDLKASSGEGFITEQIIISEEKFVDFSFEAEARLKEISFNTGTIDYTVNSKFAIPVNVLLRLPSVKQNNEIPEKFFVINPGEIKQLNWDISNAVFDLSTNPEQVYNSFPVEYTVVINSSGIPVVFNAGDELELKFRADQLSYNGAKGFLGKNTVSIEMDSVNSGLDFFNKFEGTIKLANPKIMINYSSSVGVPLKIKLNVTGFNKNDESRSLNADTFNIDMPQQPNQTIYRTIEVNKENSSVIDFLSILPLGFNYEGTGVTNPGGQHNNFVTKTSEIIAGMEFDFPLSLSTDNLTLLDTVEVNLDNSVDQVKSGVLHVVVNNGFPFDVLIKLEILDPKTLEVVKVIAIDPILSATVDQSGKVVEPRKTYVQVGIDNYTYKQLKAANHSILKIKMNTGNGGSEKAMLYSDYEIGIKTGLEFETDF